MEKIRSQYIIEGSLDISNVKAGLNELTQSMAKVTMPKGITSKLEKEIEHLNDQIARYEQQAVKGISSNADFKEIIAAGSAILEHYKKIQIAAERLKSVNGKGLKELFPEETTKNIEKAHEAMREYEGAVKQNEKAINKQNKEIASQQELLKNLRASAKAVQGKKIVDDESFQGLREQLDGVNQEIAIYQSRLKELRDKQSAVFGTPEYRTFAKEITALSKEMAQAEKTQEALNTELSQTTTAKLAAKEMKKYKTDISAAEDALGQMQTTLASLTKSGVVEALNKLILAFGQIEGIDFSQFEQSAEGAAQALNTLEQNAAADVRAGLEEVESTIKELSPAMETLADSTDQAKDAQKRFNQEVGELESVKRGILDFFGISNSINIFKRAVSSAIDTIKELDAAMTEIAVVSEYDISDMWDKLPEFTKMANEMGVSIKSAYESTTLYIQQGLNLNDSLALSTETLKMARIAGLSAADATDAMTAAMRGFNMEINETSAQKINDVYSQLAAITASDVAEISNAMTKTASIAANANMEFETTAAFLSQIIETTRESAETAGTAMKTVIARFQELKKDPSEIGEVDGEIVDANKIETALRTIGVSLRDSKGQFRDLDDVFLEISQKWDDLDTNTQRYIATMAAGSRQQSRFIAMMSDYDRTMELVNAANNSTGASQEQFEKTTESLETAITNLKNAWDQFTMKIMNSEVLTFGVNVLTSILEIINKLLEKMGSFGGMAGGILLLFGALKTGKTIFEGMFSSMFVAGTTAAKKGGVEAGRAWMQAWDTETKAKLKTWADSKKKTKIKKSRNTKGKNQNTATEQTVIVTPTVDVEQTKAALQNKLNEIKDEDLQKRIRLAIDKNDTEGIEKLRKELLETEDSIEVVEKKGAKFNLDSMLGIMTGIEQAAGATGAALLALGGAFQQSKNEGVQRFGEVISKVGMGLTVLSTIMSVVVPAAGWVMSGQLTAAIASIPIVGWIAMAITALTSLIALFVSLGKEDSYEEQLKELEEATKKASEAAEEAKQAYDSLLSELTEHNSAIDALSKLTKGTKEWKQALWETNQQALELLKTYPELGKYLKRDSETGALTFESEGLIEVQQQYFDKAIDAQSRVLGLQAYTYGTETDSAQKKVEDEFVRLGHYLDDSDKEEMWNNLDRLIGDEEYREEFARSNGLLGESIEDLIKAMEEQRKAEELNPQLYQGQTQAMLAVNASQGILNSEYSNQITDMFSNTFNPYQNEEAFAAAAKNYTPDTGSGGESHDDLVSEYKALNTGATDAEIEAMSDEQLAQAIGIAKAQADQVAAMEAFYTNFSELGIESQKKFMAAFSDGGKDMTKQNLVELEKILNAKDANGNPLDNNSIVTLWRDAMGMTEEQLNTFMSTMGYEVDDLVAFLQNQVTMANTTFEAVIDSLKQVGLDSIAQVISGINVTAAEQKALASSMYTIFLRAGKEGAEGATQALQGLMNGLTEEQTQLLIQAFNAVDWTSLDSVEEFSEIAKALGINIPLNELEGFESTMSQLAKSTKKVDLKGVLDQFSSLADAEDIVKDKIKERNSVYTQEERDKLVGLGAKEEDFVRVSLDEFVFMGETESLLNVISGNVKKIADNIIPGVEAAIQEGTKFSMLSPEQLTLVENIMSGTKGFVNKNGQVVDINGNVIDGGTAGDIEELKEIVGLITGMTSGELDGYSLENLYGLLGYRYNTYYGPGGAVLKGNIDTYTGVNSQGVDGAVLSYTSSDEILKDIAEKSQILPKAVSQIIQEVSVNGTGKENGNFAVSISYEDTSESKKATSDLNTIKTALEAQAKYYGVNALVIEEYNKALEKSNGKLTQHSASILLNAIEEKKAEEQLGNTLSKLEEVTSKYEDINDLLNNKDDLSLIAELLGFEDVNDETVAFVKENIEEILKITKGEYSSLKTIQENYFNSLQKKYKIPVTFDVETGEIDTSKLKDETGKIKEAYKKELENMMEELTGSGMFKTSYNLIAPPTKGKSFSQVLLDEVNTAQGVAEKETRALTMEDYMQAFIKALGSFGKKEEEVENTLDKYYTLMEKINGKVREREKLEREYDRMLQRANVNGVALKKNIDDRIASLKEEINLQEELLKNRKADLDAILESKDYLKYNKNYGINYDRETNTISVDWKKIDKITDSEIYEKAMDMIEELEKIRDDVDNIEGEIGEKEDQIVVLKDTGRNAYLDLEKRVINALIQQQSDLIDSQEKTNEAIEEAASDLIDSVQKNIDKMRRDRDNEKTEQSIADKERRLAYLKQDTSGANALEIKRLEEEIAQEKESYQDTLIDQALQDLQDQNDIAAEQRAEQIAAQKEQLEWDKENGAFNERAIKILEDGILNGVIDENSELYKLLSAAENAGALTEVSYEKWKEDLSGLIAEAFGFLNQREYDENTDYSQLMIDRYISNGGVIDDDIKNWNRDRNAKIDDDPELAAKYPRLETEDDIRAFLEGKIDYMQLMIDRFAANGGHIDDKIREWNARRNDKINKTGSSETKYGSDEELLKELQNRTGLNGGSEEPGPMHSLSEYVYRDRNENPAAVFELQKGLNSLYSAGIITLDSNNDWVPGYEPYEEGSKTWKAVAKLQEFLGVDADGKWGPITYDAFMNHPKLKRFKKGGLVNFTGPAWLDGTKSHPEMVLSARDTENFIVLKDLLANLIATPAVQPNPRNENYFDISVQVEEIADDYDVDQMVDRVKQKIYEDSMYRNVNSLGLLR